MLSFTHRSIAMASAPAQKTFTVGTRSSKLALLQTDLVVNELRKAYPDYKFEVLSKETAGDKNTTIAFREFTTKNLWTEELEELLIAGKVDFIVHSLKGIYLLFSWSFLNFLMLLNVFFFSFCY